MSEANSQQENEKKKYALVVGINQSTNMPQSPPPLKYAEHCAAGVSYLLGRAVCNFTFPSGILIGTGANANSVRGAIDNLINDKSENDLLLFYFVGHGCSVEIAGRFETYLITSDFDSNLVINNPNIYLSLSEIRNKLSESQTTASVICMLDCCYAGAIIEPVRSEQQHAQSLQTFIQALKAFVDDITNTTQVSPLPHRTWVALASTGPEANAYHTFMTHLIIDMLNGEIPDALDHQGNLTLLTLYNYLQHMRRPEGQDPIMHGRFGSYPWVLAYHPQENKVLRKPEDYPQSPIRQPFDMEISQATFGDLNFEQVRMFLEKERVLIQSDYQAGPDKQAQMAALDLLRNECPNWGTLLCFGHRPQSKIVGAFTRCVYWKDSRHLSGWEDEMEYRGSLLQQFAQACIFLRRHLGIESNGNSKQPEISMRVLEEALANALIHREYVTEPDHRSRAEGVQVEIFSDRVEITSPGGPPVTLDGRSHPRNPLIMRIFYLAGHVERLGTGIERMQHLMWKAGLPRPDINQSEQTFTIILSRPPQPPASQPQAIVDTPIPESLPSLNELHTQPNGHEPIVTNSISNNLVGSIDEVIEKRPAVYTEVLQPRLSDQVPAAHLPTIGLSAPKSKETSEESLVPQIKQRIIDALTPKISHPPSQMQVQYQGPKRKYNTLHIFIRYAVCFITAIGVTCSYVVYFGGRLPTFMVHPTSPASTTIEIASDFPTGGVDTTSGLPLQNGVQMAITEANNEHLLPGYTLKLVPYNDVGSDDRHDPTIGAKNLTQAIANNLIAGVIGPYNSTVALKELPIVNHAPLALLSPDAAFSCLTKSDTDDPTCTETNDIVTQMRPTGQLTFFRLATTTDRQGKANADYFTKHHSKVLLLLKDDSDLYSLGLAQVFQREWQRMGGPVISIDLPENTSNEPDYQNRLQAVASSPPDLIYFSGGLPNGGYVLEALSNIAALKMVPFASGDPVMKDSFLQMVANLHRDAPVYISLTNEDPAHSGTPTGANFEANYKANGYQDYVPDAATAYDCTMMLIQAIKTALQKGVSTPHGTQDHVGAVQFRQAILQALRQLSYTGATGKHSFDTNGDTTNHTISFYQADLSTPQPSWKWLEQVTA